MKKLKTSKRTAGQRLRAASGSALTPEDARRIWKRSIFAGLVNAEGACRHAGVALAFQDWESVDHALAGAEQQILQMRTVVQRNFIARRQTARCDYCRKVVQYEVNAIGMWLCPVCRRDMTPPPNDKPSCGGKAT